MKRTFLVFALGTLFSGPAVACISNVGFTGVTAVSVTLTWDEQCPADTVLVISRLRIEPAEVDSFPVYGSPDSKTARFDWVNPTDGIQPNATIQFGFFVRIISSGQTWRFDVSTTTAALPPDPPDLPSSPYASVGWDQMRVQWIGGHWDPTPSIRVSNYPDTHFQLQISSTSNFAVSVFDQTAPVKEMDIRCLEPSTVYYSRVRALNRANRPTNWISLGSTRTLSMGGAPPSTYGWDNSRWRATFPAGFLGQRDSVMVSSTPTASPIRSASVSSAIEKANKKILDRGDARRIPLYVSEIRLDRGCPAVSADALDQPVEIDVGVDLSNGLVITPAGPLRPDSLRVYRLNESDQLWVRVPTRQDTSLTRLSASVQELGVFGVFGSRDDSLEAVFAYPTPYSRSQGGAGITFVNMPEQATLTLYSAAATPVRTLEESDGDGRLLWDTRNTSGEPVAPGVYFYVLESPSEKRKGRVMIQP
jgi:hypothetical protein